MYHVTGQKHKESVNRLKEEEKTTDRQAGRQTDYCKFTHSFATHCLPKYEWSSSKAWMAWTYLDPWLYYPWYLRSWHNEMVTGTLQIFFPLGLKHAKKFVKYVFLFAIFSFFILEAHFNHTPCIELGSKLTKHFSPEANRK